MGHEDVSNDNFCVHHINGLYLQHRYGISFMYLKRCLKSLVGDNESDTSTAKVIFEAVHAKSRKCC